MTGDLTIDKGSPTITLDASAGQAVIVLDAAAATRSILIFRANAVEKFWIFTETNGDIIFYNNQVSATFLSVAAGGTAITLGTDLAVTEGGTGASTAANARTNLGLVAAGAGDIWVEKAGDTMTGTLNAVAIASTSSITSSATAGIGYATGAGGSVTQLTDKTTAVTLNTICGQITMASESVGAGARRTFTVNDSAVAATDGVVVGFVATGTPGQYAIWVSAMGTGSFSITIKNDTSGALNEQPVLWFVVIKAVTA